MKILTPDQVRVVDDAGKATAFDRDILGEVAPVRADGSRVDVVLVVINLELLERMYWSGGSAPSDLQSDIDRVVVHEVYGHALPYLIAGDASGRCADPKPGQRAADACSVRRENAVRAELGLGKRTDSGIGGLALTRRTLMH